MAIIRRKLILVFLDAILVNAALFGALYLRFDGVIPAEYLHTASAVWIYLTVMWVALFYFSGFYNRLWRYASVGELLAIVGVVSAGVVAAIAIVTFAQLRLPRSVFAIYWGIGILLIGGSRMAWRLFREHILADLFPNPHKALPKGRPALIVGAGDAGVMVVRELKKSNGLGSGVNPVAFVDDDPVKQKQQLLGIPVLGGKKDIARLVRELGIEEIIIAMPSAPGYVVRELVDICRKTSVELKIVPRLYEIIEGHLTVSALREVQVEDLLCREPVKVDLEEISGYLQGKCVMVTGAGGSIGSELCRQVACHRPSTLILLGHDENPIFEIEQELKRHRPSMDIRAVICDIKDRGKTDSTFKRYKPRVVFHAAAHKHVPLMEENPEEAVKNNVLGTKNAATAADKYGADTFIYISTDKAVNPTSVMGATKRISEMLVQTMSERSKTRFAAVRFGNVLGSRGSVLPTFKEQIARGGPLTVTHREMTRYFMTIPEAVQLVIQAGAMAQGGEVFVLDMGEPVKIMDMAEDLIRLSGLEPHRDIKITITGIRPGEKLYEELLTAEEGTSATKHKKIFIAKTNNINTDLLEEYLILFQARNWAESREDLLKMIKQLVPTYHVEERSCTG